MDRWVERYYLATPLFALVDWTLGANVRAVALAEHPHMRAAWYAGCVVVGLAMHWRPAWSGILGLLESGTNLLLLVLSVLLPYWTFADRVLDGTATASPLTPAFMANFGLAAGAALLLFYRSGGLPGPGYGARRA